MYKTYFGLKRDPFSVAADPRFIYMSPQHRQAAHHLLLGLQSGAGFILLTGEVGAGKTMVCRAFLRLLPANADVVNVVNPRVSFHALLLRICEDLRIELSGECPDLIDAIHGHLLLAHAQGRRTLIVVDEAQALSHEVLELLRLLTNLDTTGRKLQIFLIGQPELRDTLRLPALKPVTQRIVARFHLNALPESQTARYIEHRLVKAGLTGPLPFDAQSMKAIHKACDGVPRRINVLCDRAMLTAKNLQTREINAQLIERITPEVFDLPSAVAGPAPAEIPTPTAERLAEALMEEPQAASIAETAVAVGALESAIAESSSGRRKRRWGRALAVACAGVVACAAFGAVMLDFRHSSSITSGAKPARSSTAAISVSVPPTDPVPLPAHKTAPSSPSTEGSAVPVQAASTQPETPTSTSELPLDPPAPSVGEGQSPEAALSGIQVVFDAAPVNEFVAWRELASLWSVTLPPGDPCAAAIQYGLRCHRTIGGLESIRRLDRPSILNLQDPEGHTAFVLLVGLSDGTARLRSGDQEYTVPLDELAGRWQGAFATLWRAPPSFHRGATADESDMADWLRERFTVLDETAELDSAAAVARRVAAFQVANGLQPDGIAGPVTLMTLNRLSRVSEPQLLIER